VCAEFHDEHVRNVQSRRVQVDEIWSFTYAKSKNVEKAKKAPTGAGDTWTWTAIDPDCFAALTSVIHTVTPSRAQEATPAARHVPELAEDYGQAA